jgi:UDP-N-acetylglucosamine 2-epimerase (non-hydrolysing)
MKTAPVIAELKRRADRFESLLVHTGQHYDHAMSAVFFEQLEVDAPDIRLGVGSGTHAVQTARLMERLEPALLELAPDVVLVPGDVNSTMAATLVASKLGFPIAHLEAGLRSFDRAMPEEINRVVTDQLSDVLFVHSPEAVDNLLREGRPRSAIHFVGNTMIDTLSALRERFDGRDTLEALGIDGESFLLVTLHRPALVDGPLLDDAMERLADISSELPVVFPAHPRTQARLGERHRFPRNRLHVIDPLGYLEFMGLVAGATAVLTDSGGVQEETTVLGVPCFTLRDNTERPVTVAHGTNTLLGLDPVRIADVPRLLAAAPPRRMMPERWDGRAAERVVDALESMRTGSFGPAREQ